MYEKLLKTYQEKDTIKYSKEDLLKTSLTTFYVSKMFKENIRTLNMEEKINSFSDL